MWLIAQLWWAMALSAGAGALLTVLLSTKRVSVERWVDAPVEAPAPVEVQQELQPAVAAPSVAAPVQEELDSPFPSLSGARPWEEEELWSRPARVAVGAGRKNASGDGWSEAAENWRDWAGVATGKVAVPGDERAARPWDSPVEADPFFVPPAEAFTPDVDEAPFPFAGPVDAPVRRDEPADPFPYAEPVDPFPYAQPVDVGDDQDDDDREAEEIRRALELRRRDREAAERLKAELLAAERAEAERLERERDRADRERIEQDRVARLEAQRLEAERVAQLEAQRLEAERAEAERLEAERLEAERAGAERLEAERAEAERLEVERAEAARLEAQRAEAQRLEAERVARLEAQRLEAERLEAERVARLEAQRLEAERAEAERLEAERLEAERVEAERMEAERLARLEARRLEAERLEAERAEVERIERERQARLEAERLEAERLEAERLEFERRQQELTSTAADDDQEWRKGPYGSGSAYAPYDGSAPDGYSVKGHVATKTFHTRRSRLYARAQADVWFDSEESAEAAGFVRWDRRGTSLGTVVGAGDE